ncbi:MAG: hypothetical protein WHX52_22060, partial [Anaerolineae bacterium]
VLLYGFGAYCKPNDHPGEIHSRVLGLNYNIVFVNLGAERAAFWEASWQKYWIKSYGTSLLLNLGFGGSAELSRTWLLSKEWSVNPDGWDKLDRVRFYTASDIQR